MYSCSLGFLVSVLTPDGPYTIISLMLDLSSLLSLADIHLPVGHLLICVNSTGLVGVLSASKATPVVLNGLSGSKPNAATPIMSGGSCCMNCVISSSDFQSVPESPSTSSASALISEAMVWPWGSSCLHWFCVSSLLCSGWLHFPHVLNVLSCICVLDGCLGLMLVFLGLLLLLFLLALV